MIFHCELWKFFHLLYESGTEILISFQMSPFLFHHSLSKDWTKYVSRFDQIMNFNQGHIQCQLIGCENLFQIRLPGIIKWGKEEEKLNPFMWLSTGFPGYLHYNYSGPQKFLNLWDLFSLPLILKGQYSEAFSHQTSVNILVLVI